MKPQFILYAVAITVFIALSSAFSESKESGHFTYENVQDNLFVFEMNDAGNITQYVVIQGTDYKPGQITRLHVEKESKRVVITTQHGYEVFSLVDDVTEGLHGIAHFTPKKGQSLKREDILADMESISVDSDCDERCRAGSCGATAAGWGEDSGKGVVTCAEGYFACCTIVSSSGCHCLPADCCP